MNCQDLSSILDDRDIAGLGEVERDEIASHLHGCADCAREWTAQQRLSAAPIPSMPAALARHCRVLVAAQSTAGADRQGRRRTSRLILIGTLAAVAAAAALLSTVLRNSGPARPVIAAATPAPAESAPVLAEAPAVVEPAAPKSSPVVPKKKAEPLAESPRFTVRVLPLQDRTTDESSSRAVKSFYASLLDGLRKVPGLTLVESEVLASEIAPAEFHLKVTGDGPVQDGWSAKMMVTASLPVTGDTQGRRATVPHSFQYSSVAFPRCTGSLVDRPAVGCSDPEGGAAAQIELMRQVVFPPDPSLRQVLQARLQDRTLDPAQRLKALQSLRSFRAVVVAGPTAPRMTQERSAIDAETLRGAVNLALTAPAPGIRAQTWEALRAARLPELIQPLIDASRLETDEATRLEAVTTLARDYAQDPKARAALDTLSRDDSRELVRMVARRALAGEQAWNDYAAARLQDESLPDAQRIEALTYVAASAERDPQLAGLLDTRAVEALSVIVPRTLAQSGVAPDAIGLRNLVGALASSNQPATVALLISTLNASNDPQIRRTAITGLARHLDDARAREIVEYTAAHDADPRLREIAAVRQNQLVTPPPGT